MRSNKVFEALQTMPNRYMLCQLASKATRKFHRPNTRIQETMNEVLDRISDAQSMQAADEKPSEVTEQQRAA